MRILCIADLHVGSRKGIAPKSAFDNYTNEFQGWILERWENDFVPKYGNPDYLCLLGDIVDGPGSKSSVELITTDVDRQAEFAVELISPLIGASTGVIGLAGSGYHRGKGTGFDADYHVVKGLGGTWNRERFTIPFMDENILFVHRAININTEIKKIAENVIRQKYYRRPTMVVAAHQHSYASYEISGLRIVHIPCFEYLTECMEGVPKMPDIGGYEMKSSQGEMVSSCLLYHIPENVFEAMDHWEARVPSMNEEITEGQKTRAAQLILDSIKNLPPGGSRAGKEKEKTFEFVPVNKKLRKRQH
jgi:hypothetical protein